MAVLWPQAVRPALQATQLQLWRLLLPGACMLPGVAWTHRELLWEGGKGSELLCQLPWERWEQVRLCCQLLWEWWEQREPSFHLPRVQWG